MGGTVSELRASSCNRTGLMRQAGPPRVGPACAGATVGSRHHGRAWTAKATRAAHRARAGTGSNSVTIRRMSASSASPSTERSSSRSSRCAVTVTRAIRTRPDTGRSDSTQAELPPRAALSHQARRRGGRSQPEMDAQTIERLARQGEAGELTRLNLPGDLGGTTRRLRYLLMSLLQRAVDSPSRTRHRSGDGSPHRPSPAHRDSHPPVRTGSLRR